MRRTMNADLINSVANASGVFPFLALPPGVLRGDLSPLVLNPENVTLVSDCGRGAYILHKISPCLYVAHSLALKSARGHVMQALMRDGFAYMYTQTDAIEIQTVVPTENRPATIWAHLAGFRPMFRRESAMVCNGILSDVVYMTQNYMDWAVRDDINQKEGEAFHDGLGGHLDHRPDPVHDRWVGATLRCAKAGNLHKGVQLYNRWAALVGYLPVQIISHNPPLVDMGGDIVSLSERGVEFLHTRKRAPSPPPEGLSNDDAMLGSQSCRPASESLQ
jgi:hypothetical protein